MKLTNTLTLMIIIGFLTLFFFPEPETNFLWYFLTGLAFIFIIIILITKSKKEKRINKK